MDIVSDKLKRGLRFLAKLKDQEQTDKYDWLIEDIEYIHHIVRLEPVQGQHFNTPRRKHDK